MLNIFSKKNKTVIDIGSQKITVAVGHKSADSISVVGSGEADYAGYLDGEFIEIEKLGSAIKQAINLAERNSKTVIKSVYVGVPTTFCIAITKEVVQNKNRMRVSKTVIDNLVDLGNDFYRFSTHRIISVDPLYYELDGGKTTTRPIGCVTSSIKAHLSYVLAEEKFLNTIEDILNTINIRVEGYFCSAVAEAQYLLRDKETINDIIIDCGHLSTSVAIVRGEGLIGLNEFTSGGGFVTQDLMKWMKISYDTADALKRKCVLSINPDPNERYEVKNGSVIESASAYYTNAIVSNVVQIIGKTILKCLKQHSDVITEDMNIYLTGGGLCYIKGAKDLLSNMFCKDVSIIAPDLAGLNKPNYSSVLSLLYVATNI